MSDPVADLQAMAVFFAVAVLTIWGIYMATRPTPPSTWNERPENEER